MSIFIKNLTIENFKCFRNKPIEFSVPDGSPGSGLNILIGENGNGKTTVLEAINYLTLNNFTAENKLSISDFNDYKKEMKVSAQTDEYSCSSSIDFYKSNSWSFIANGIKFTAQSRDTKERGKLLSSPFRTTKQFMITGDNYLNSDGSIHTDREGESKYIDGRDKIFSNARIQNDELNIFFFDKNRTRQLTIGNYKTTFEKICDDLNWTFVKNLDKTNIDKIIISIAGDYFKQVDDITDKGLGKKTAIELKNFFDKDEFSKIRIELLNLLHPFTNSFFALRDKDDLSQIIVKDLGSGVEMILTLLLLKNIAANSKGSIIYLIDEPELHLHPKAQEKLLDLLIEEAKSKQIIVSTHSPYLFKGAISKNARLLLFTRNKRDEITITDARKKGWGLFVNWSPSWGEINFFAYDMPTIEFHDELYGYLHEIFISKASDQVDADNRSRQIVFDQNYLQTKIAVTKIWTPEIGMVAKTKQNVTLATFIRNKIHHPENITMKSLNFSDDELRVSIKSLISLLNNP